MSLGGFLWYNCVIPGVILLVLAAWSFKRIHCDINDFLLVALLAFGIMSVFFTEADKQTVIYEFEKLICLVLAVYVGRNLERKNIATIIVVMAFITALCGILSYCNILQFNGFVFDDRGTHRLQSFIQYANTTAIVLGMGYFLSLDKFHDNKKMPFMSGVILIALYFTLSKAAIPMFMLVGTVLIVLKKQYATYFIGQNICCMLMSIPIILAINERMYIIGLLLISLTVFLTIKIIGIPINKKWIYIWVSIILLFVILGVVIAFIYKGTILSTFLKRLDYMKDAAVLLKEHWIFGIGSGAWSEYQYLVQTTQYSVKYVHNGWLQFLLDNGIFFFLTFITLFATTLYSTIKSKSYTVMTALLLLAMHSFVDFDFSFGVVLLITGLIIGGYSKTKILPSAVMKIPMILNFVICGLLIIYMSTEYIVRHNFEQNIRANEYETAVSNAIVLEKICPYDSNLQITLADLKIGDSQERYERAIKYAPNNKNVLGNYITFSINNTNKDIIELCKLYIELAPKQEETYMNVNQYIEDTFEKGRCTEEQYNEFCKYVVDKMKIENVINRNELLEQIVTD